MVALNRWLRRPWLALSFTHGVCFIFMGALRMLGIREQPSPAWESSSESGLLDVLAPLLALTDFTSAYLMGHYKD